MPLAATVCMLGTGACITPAARPERPPPVSTAQAPGTVLLTVFMRHDESRNLNEIRSIQDEQGFWASFPPEGTSVVSWYVMMGIGQVVTLEVPAAKLRDVNVALEKTAWKAFRTEFYPTYDLYPFIQEKLSNKARTKL
jgi:hypothetical protein